MRAHVSFATLLLTLAVGQPSTAATIAVELGSGGFQSADYGLTSVTLGWGFSLTTPLTVTDLGYFDGNLGLVDPHPVGIWDSIGNLLATATVPSGGAGALVNGFRFVPITPVTLGAGFFTIGGFANGTSPDPFRFQVPTLTPVAGLSFGPPVLFTRAASLARPTSQADVFNNGYFGPNFLVGTATPTVPEPAAIGITLLGLAMVFVFSQSRRRPWRAMSDD
ncbi:MAG TPA: hypothetical protein VNV86_09500 [Candidatus Acidoferrum sp.]|jgi:hypothetical protein|nr:hypothetical protein [Candidatus Acidoferrum sp.]